MSCVAPFKWMLFYGTLNIEIKRRWIGHFNSQTHDNMVISRFKGPKKGNRIKSLADRGEARPV